MRIAQGVFAGNIGIQRINVGFLPQLVIVKSDSASGDDALFNCPETFAGRSNRFGAAASVPNGVRIEEDGFWVGSNNSCNHLGQNIYWLALGFDGDNSFDTLSYMGNATAGRVVSSSIISSSVRVAFIKRDSALAGVVGCSDYSPSAALMDGSSTTSTAYITAYGAGSITIGSDSHVNELTGANGEGINALLFTAAGSNCSFTTWTGDGTTSRVINLPIPAQAVIIFRMDGVSSPRMLTASAPTLSFPLKAAGPQSTDGSLTGVNGAGLYTTFTSGSGTALNANAVQYGCLVFGADSGAAQIVDPCPSCAVGSGRQVIELSGTAYIDCGTSNTIQVSPPLSVELMLYNTYKPNINTEPGPDATLFSRMSGPVGAYTVSGIQGTASMWIGEVLHDNTALGWGSILDFIVSNYADPTDTDTSAGVLQVARLLRSGIQRPAGKFYHLVATYAASGVIRIYMNGRLVKLRDYDMVANQGLQNVTGGSGHRTVIGGRYDGTQFLGFCEMLFALARMYNSALTPAQVYARYRRAAFNDTSYADVTPLEEWDAANTYGQSLGATINSANSGTIVGGNIVTL